MKKNNNIQGIRNIEDKELFSLLIGTKGGATRMRILDEIIIMPSNANQLSKTLNLDYKTVTYNLNIICNHHFATKEKFGKKTIYYPSDRLIKKLESYYLIKEYIIRRGRL